MAAVASPRPALLKTGIVLWLASILGVVLVIPYVAELQPQALDDAVAQTGLPVATLIAVSLVQSAVLMAAAIFGGLWAARRLGFGSPILDAALTGSGIARQDLQRLGVAAVLGAIAALLIVLADWTLFPPLTTGDAISVPQPAAWKGLLASFYGAVNEELLLRLGLLSLIALGLRRASRIFRASQAGFPAWVFWSANVIAALLFGVAHLPAASAVAPLTAVNVAHVVALNGFAGIVFGWLYWRSGLEAAMCAHFSADIVLHVLLPILN